MTAIYETAYPRLKSYPTRKELGRVWTPTSDEIGLARRTTKRPAARLGFLILLKAFQRLGYFCPIADVPWPVIRHLAAELDEEPIREKILAYERSGTRRRHCSIIREYLKIRPYGPAAQQLVERSVTDAARTKDEIPDLINVAIEELVRARQELPSFATLKRLAKRCRVQVHRKFYRSIAECLSEEDKALLNALFQPDPERYRTGWHELKQEPGAPTLTSFRLHIERVRWLSEQWCREEVLRDIPAVKIHRFAAEAKTLDASRMKEMEPNKRYALTLCLLKTRIAGSRDELAELFIKRMAKTHNSAKQALRNYRDSHADETGRLVEKLRDLTLAYCMEGEPEERLKSMGDVFGGESEKILERCEQHLIYGTSHLPFLWPHHCNHRSVLFRCLRLLAPRSTSQDRSMEQTIAFLLDHENARRNFIDVADYDRHTGKMQPLLDLSWVPTGWWQVLTGRFRRNLHPGRVDRRYFELCVLTQVMRELKSGDLYIERADEYSDYREQLIDWDEYHQLIEQYTEKMGLPTKPRAFVRHVRDMLERVAKRTDAALPRNEFVRIEDGRPIIKRAAGKKPSAQARVLEEAVARRMEPVSIVDVLAVTASWLDWARFFGPVSGHDSKLDNPLERYITNTLCYGCYLGPTQTARSFGSRDRASIEKARRQIAWINRRHVTEDGIVDAVVAVINDYNRFLLPRFWGSGNTASADGTKWDLYEKNLLAEYHIRYGGYGGIGYYHVSDTYIALFSHFIPCGVWEAVYILDGLIKNQAEIQPDTVHADTQGQSAVVFGLAYLLGIKLMPRIRNWKELRLARPRAGVKLSHIDELLSDPVDWKLIARHLPDMLRVVLSIQAGRLTPSAILRRLSSYNRKNRLYQAFRELGVAVRTAFLLDYIGDIELRRMIQAGTNKSEGFNQFAQWLAFGGERVVASNDRDEQRKIIKYNHLVANLLIHYNVSAMTKVLNELIEEGYEVTPEHLGILSPYITKHVNRFGRYTLELSPDTVPVDYELSITSVSEEVPEPVLA